VAKSTALDVAVDDDYLYVYGFDENLEWRIEKRLKSTGDLCTGGNCVAGDFGDSGSGVIIATGIDVENSWTDEGGIAIDGNYIYVAGMDSAAGGGSWHIRKYDIADGDLCTGGNCSAGDFGDGGSGAITVSSNTADGVNDLAIDDSYMYLAGWRSQNLNGWYMEKRLLTTGALDTNFGGFGAAAAGTIEVYNDGDAWVARDVAIDDVYMYIFGNLDNTDGWRIEKRSLLTGELDNVPGELECRGL